VNKIAIKYALFITASAIIVKLGIYHAGMQHAEIGRFALLIPVFFLLIGLFFGIREMKKNIDENNPGDLKSDAKNGIRISAFTAIFFSAFVYVYYTYIDAHFFNYRINEGIKSLFEQGSPKEELTRYYQNAHFFLNPSRQAYFTFFGYLFMGLLYSVALAFIFSRKLIQRSFGK
jgi:hypothetical protein